jgi:hypothetical protein
MQNAKCKMQNAKGKMQMDAKTARPSVGFSSVCILHFAF